VRLDEELIAALKEVAHQLGQGLQEIIHAAAVQFLESPAVQSYKTGDGRMALDDKMIWKTRDDIIILYEQYSGNKWKGRDDIIGQAYNETDGRIIEIGIIQTLMNHRQGAHRQEHIHTFRYFTHEINKIIDAPFNRDLLDAYLKRRREVWRELSSIS